jgi:hypothetical protein
MNINYKFFKSRNLIEGICFIAFALFIFIQTSGTPGAVSLIPRTMAGIIALMGVILIYKARVELKLESTSTLQKTSQSYKLVLVVIFVLALFWILIQLIGFYVTSFFLIMFFYFYFDHKKTAIHIITGIVFSAFMTVLLYLIFHNGLRLLTPTGILF